MGRLDKIVCFWIWVVTFSLCFLLVKDTLFGQEPKKTQRPKYMTPTEKSNIRNSYKGSVRLSKEIPKVPVRTKQRNPSYEGSLKLISTLKK